jgi:RNA polymerase sigma-70 factor (ECF subfamily)
MDESSVLAVRRLREGQAIEDSAEVLVGKLRPRLTAYFHHHGFSDADAADLVQETFRRVLTGVRGLNDESKFLPWLFQIARNVRFTARAVVMHRQEETLEAIEDAATAQSSDDPVSNAIHRQRLERTQAAMEKLPPQQKQCLVLRAIHEMSYEEIATVLRLSVSTVRNHLREGRLNLRRMVERTEGESDERVR